MIPAWLLGAGRPVVEWGLTWFAQATALLALGLMAARLIRRRGPAVESAVVRTTLAAVGSDDPVGSAGPVAPAGAAGVVGAVALGFWLLGVAVLGGRLRAGTGRLARLRAASVSRPAPGRGRSAGRWQIGSASRRPGSGWPRS